MQTFTLSGGHSPASGLFAFLPPTVTPEAYRAAIGDEIERLIAHLDALDGDTDLELENEHGDGNVDDEPSLGSLNGTAPFDFTPRRGPYISQARWADGGLRDAELDESDLEDSHDREASDLAGVGFGGNLEEDAADKEPSLGSFDRKLNQEHWTSDSIYACSDREHDDCDREDGGDTEPNGDTADFSDDPGGMDGGIGDYGGLTEQCGGAQ